MSNLLLKNSPRVVILRPAVPAVPAVSPIPAWNETVITTTIVRGPIIAWMATSTNFTIGGVQQGVGYVHAGATQPPVPFALGGGVYVESWSPIYGRGTEVTSTRIIHHPAVAGNPGSPAIPAETLVLDNVGWNAGAISVDSISGNGQFKFSVDLSSAGVVTGLNDGNEGANYPEINYGIYCLSGKFQVIEYGVVKTTAELFEDGDVFAVVRMGKFVRYFRNTTLLYSSTVHSFGTLFSDASLLLGGVDRIVDASIESTVDVEFAAQFPINSGGTGGGAGDGSDGGDPAGTVPPLGGIGGIGVGGSYFSVIGQGVAYDSGHSAFDYAEALGSFALEGGGQDNIPNSGGTGVGIGGVVPPAGGIGGAGVGGSYIVVVGQGSNFSYAEAMGRFRVVGIGGDFIDFPDDETIDNGGDNAGLGAGTHAIGGGDITPVGVGSNFAYTFGSGVFAIDGLGSSNTGDETQQPGLNFGSGGGSFTVQGIGYAFDSATTQFALAAGSFTLEGHAEGGLLAPQYSVTHGTLTEFTGWGYSGFANTGEARGSFGVTGFGSNFDYSEARGSFELEGYGTSPNGLGILIADLFQRNYVFIALGHSEGGPFGVRATLPMLTFAGYGGGAANVSLPSLDISATGTVQILGRLDAALPAITLSGTGTAPIVGRLAKTLPALTLRGYSGGKVDDSLPMLTIAGAGTAPSLGRLAKTLPKLTMQGFGGGRLTKTLPELAITAAGTAPLVARLVASLPHVVKVSLKAGGGLSSNLPALTISGSGTVPDVARLVKDLPGRYPFTGFGGGVGGAELPLPTLAGAGTAPIVGRANVRVHGPYSVVGYSGGLADVHLPKITLVGTGTAPSVGRLNKSLSRLSLVGYGGGILSVEIPALTLSATATAADLGRLTATLPGLELTASATIAMLGRLNALLPAMQMVARSKLDATLPLLTIVATGTAGSITPEYEAYSITLIEQDGGGSAVAVTRITQYPFDRIVRWKNKYYGIATDGIYELGGETFNDDPIVAVIESHPTDFDYAGFKRIPNIYVTGRVGADFDVTVIADEAARYTYRMARQVTDRGTATHRVPVGKGIKAHYVAIGWSNVLGEPFTIEVETPEIAKLRRSV